jgi:hypothetical protein
MPCRPLCLPHRGAPRLVSGGQIIAISRHVATAAGKAAFLPSGEFGRGALPPAIGQRQPGGLKEAARKA